MKRSPVAVLVLVASFAIAPAVAVTTNIPSAGLPSATDYSAAILPERDGIVSWRTLAQVQPVKQGNKFVPEFSKDILALDRKDQKVQGFMVPLDLGDKQKRFLITAVPMHCSFCLPAGPDAIVEVVAKTPVRYTIDPVVVTGRFEVVKNDPNGILYRLTEAAQVEAAPASNAPASARPAR